MFLTFLTQISLHVSGGQMDPLSFKDVYTLSHGIYKYFSLHDIHLHDKEEGQWLHSWPLPEGRNGDLGYHRLLESETGGWKHRVREDTQYGKISVRHNIACSKVGQVDKGNNRIGLELEKKWGNRSQFPTLRASRKDCISSDGYSVLAQWDSSQTSDL